MPLDLAWESQADGRFLDGSAQLIQNRDRQGIGTGGRARVGFVRLGAVVMPEEGSSVTGLMDGTTTGSASGAG